MEKIVVKIEVDGIELTPIDMGPSRQDSTYKDDIAFYKMGNAGLARGRFLPYQYSIGITRHKTKEEKEVDNAGP